MKKMRWRAVRTEHRVLLGIIPVTIVSVWVRWEDKDKLGVVGFVVTAAGVLIAVAIYLRQQRETDEATAVVRGDLKELSASLRGGPAEPDEQGPDQFQFESDIMESRGLTVTNGFRALAPRDVPLRLIADVVHEWDKDGKTGRWSVGNLRGALRREGKGNHAWYIAFSGPSVGEDLRVWKVSRGGRGNSGTMVTAVQ